jgi:ribonuclease HII
MILGIDEVGRGPWAGPLVVGAVVLGGHEIEGLTDSKKLSAKKRLVLDEVIRTKAAGFGLGWVHADELDKIGLAQALRVATIRAVEQITVPYHEIIIDGTINFLSETSKGQFVTTLPKADLLVPSVSAASIIAKVARDAYMAAQDAVYSGYSFSGHVGYGTAAHRAALDKLGVTPLHRTSFAPIAKMLETTTAIGANAEAMVAEELTTLGWNILERNWRTKYCEIDIIATKDGKLAFVEVKHRTTSRSGDGIAMITAKKLQQMRFAAEVYLAKNAHYDTLQPSMWVASSSGDTPKLDQLLQVE